MSLQGLKFEFSDIRGSRSISGPFLDFSVKVKIDSRSVRIEERNGKAKVPTAFFYVTGGSLSLKGSNGEILVGKLFASNRGFEALSLGDEQEVSLGLQLTDVGMRDLIELGRSRTFNLWVYAMGNFLEGDIFQIWRTQLNGEIFSHGMFQVVANIGAPNDRYFQIPIEKWRDAINGTKSGKYLIREIVVAGLQKPHVKVLMQIVNQSEDLLLEGKLEEALSRLRKIPEWMGHKRKGEPDLYHKLRSIDLSKHERETVIHLLDFLWEWTSRGHHSQLDANGTIKYDQVRSALEISYSLVSIFSRYDYVEEKTASK